MLAASRKSTTREISPTTSHVRNDAEITDEASLDGIENGNKHEWPNGSVHFLEKGEINTGGQAK